MLFRHGRPTKLATHEFVIQRDRNNVYYEVYDLTADRCIHLFLTAESAKQWLDEQFALVDAYEKEHA